jgi:hypothetical protein
MEISRLEPGQLIDGFRLEAPLKHGGKQESHLLSRGMAPAS